MYSFFFFYMKTRKETTSSLLKKFSAYPSRFAFARGMVLGGILTLSISSLVTQASVADGVFGDYFTRIVTDAA